MKLKRATKARRVAFFILIVVMLCGLHMFAAMIHRPIPWWFDLGWLGLFGAMCWGGWEDEGQPRARWAESSGMQRLGYAFVLVLGVLMCWVGWTGWKSRGDGSMTGLLAIFLPIGALWLLWLAGKLLFRLLSRR